VRGLDGMGAPVLVPASPPVSSGLGRLLGRLLVSMFGLKLLMTGMQVQKTLNLASLCRHLKLPSLVDFLVSRTPASVAYVDVDTQEPSLLTHAMSTDAHRLPLTRQVRLTAQSLSIFTDSLDPLLAWRRWPGAAAQAGAEAPETLSSPLSPASVPLIHPRRWHSTQPASDQSASALVPVSCLSSWSARETLHIFVL
jgi:hypothetical protein